MELTQLQYFMAVADSTHISRTAEALHVSQSALSMSISRLEGELGVKLFEKQGRNIALTYAGRLLAARIAPALAEIENARTELRNLSLERGEEAVNLAVEVPDFAADLVVNYLAAVPTARLRQTFDTVEMAEERLSRGKADFRIGYQPMERPGVTSELLQTDRVLLLVNKNHPLAAREGVWMEELRDEAVVTMGEEYGFRKWTNQLCFRSGFRPKACLEVCDLQTITRLVENGLGVGFMSRDTWKNNPMFVSHWDADYSTVCAVPVLNAHCVRTVYLSYLGERRLTAGAEKFLRFAVDYAARRNRLF